MMLVYPSHSKGLGLAEQVENRGSAPVQLAITFGKHSQLAFH